MNQVVAQPQQKKVEELAAGLKRSVLDLLEGKLRQYATWLFDATDANSFREKCAMHKIDPGDADKVYSNLEKKGGGTIKCDARELTVVKIGDALEVYSHNATNVPPQKLIEGVKRLQRMEPGKDWRQILQYATTWQYEPRVRGSLNEFMQSAREAGLSLEQEE